MNKRMYFMQDKIEYQINFGEAKAMTFLSLAGI